MPCCAVFGCNNHNKLKGLSDVKFYSFPKNQDLALKWIKFCRRENINLKNACICSKHFESKYLFTSLKYRLLNESEPRKFRNLQDEAVPTIYDPSTFADSEESQRKETQEGLEARKRIIDEILSNAEKNDSVEQVESQILLGADSECETEYGYSRKREDLIKELKSLKKTMFAMDKEIKLLKSSNEKLLKEKTAANFKLSGINEALSLRFTEGQVKRLLNPEQTYSCWSTEDIEAANALRNVSIHAYKYLQLNGFPLPGLSTLRRWKAQKAKQNTEEEIIIETEYLPSDDSSFME